MFQIDWKKITINSGVAEVDSTTDIAYIPESEKDSVLTWEILTYLVLNEK